MRHENSIFLAVEYQFYESWSRHVGIYATTRKRGVFDKRLTKLNLNKDVWIQLNFDKFLTNSTNSRRQNYKLASHCDFQRMSNKKKNSSNYSDKYSTKIITVIYPFKKFQILDELGIFCCWKLVGNLTRFICKYHLFSFTTKQKMFYASKLMAIKTL